MLARVPAAGQATGLQGRRIGERYTSVAAGTELQEDSVDWSLLWMAFGLALIIEGAPYFLFPDRLGSLLRQLEAMQPPALRMLGLIIMLAGVALLLVGRTLR